MPKKDLLNIRHSCNRVGLREPLRARHNRSQTVRGSAANIAADYRRGDQLDTGKGILEGQGSRLSGL